MAKDLKMARRREAGGIPNGLGVGMDQPIGVGFGNAEVLYGHEGLDDNGEDMESDYPLGRLGRDSQAPMARQKHSYFRQ